MATETLRPNAAGDETNIVYEAPAGQPHYTLVDEVTPDGDATIVIAKNDDWERDLYNITDHSTGSGTINKITAYARARYVNTNDRASLKICIKTGGTAYESTERTMTGSYADYSNEWANNPKTSSAWTWDDIDALQIGVSGRDPLAAGGDATRITQVWVEVDYTSSVEKTSSDSGTGSEGAPLPSAALAGSDGGQGQGSTSPQLAALISAEQGSSVELGALLKELLGAELGQGTDSLAAKIEAPTKGGGMKLWI